MFSRDTRFKQIVPHAPPVGSYHIKDDNKKSGSANFLRSKRFDESKDLANTSSVNLDSSTCSISSKSYSKCNTSVFTSPLPVKMLKRGISASTPDLSNNDRDLEKELHKVIQENIEQENKLALTLQDIDKLEAELKAVLQEKSGLEAAVAALENEVKDLVIRANKLLENEVNSTTNRTGSLESELINARKELEAKEKELLSLQLQLDCKVESVMADLNLEKTRNAALNERIISLEQTNTEVRHDRDLVEGDNFKLHEMVAELREENIHWKEKVEEREHELDAYHAKIESAVLEGESKIAALQHTLSNEIINIEAKRGKLENMLKLSEQNVLMTRQRVEELNELNSNLGDELEHLEEKLKEGKHMAEEEIRSLVAEKTAVESQQQTRYVESEKKLNVANGQVELMQRELTRNEEVMTDNLRSLTEKYESLEKSFANATAKHDQKSKALTMEIEALKSAAHERQTECDQLHVTCVSLSEQLTVEYKDNEELKGSCQKFKKEMLSAQDEAKSFEEKLSRVLQETEGIKGVQTQALAELNEHIVTLTEGKNAVLLELQIARGCQKTQEEKLHAVEKELQRYKSEIEVAAARIEQFEEKRTLQVEEREKKVKEEFGRRLMETQKKLSQAEMTLIRFKEERESELKIVKEECNRRLLANEKEVEELKQEFNTERDERLLEDMNSQIQMWQEKCAELEEKIEPFKDQLNSYEAEKKALLCQKTEAHSEVSKLSLQYAKLLGHQNQRQKIHHVMKMKEENLRLKTENSKLREQCDKQKRGLKGLEERVNQLSGKKRFNPAEAFSHSKKENMPLSVISGGKLL